MKNQRHYEVVELEQPFKRLLGKEELKFVLSETKNGETKLKDVNWYAYATREEAEAKCEEYNHTFYLSDYADEEIVEWFNKIDFSQLYEKANQVIGLDLHYNCKAKKSSRGLVTDGFEISSVEDLSKMDNTIGKMLRAAWKEFKVETFSSSICVEKETGKLYIWGNLDFKYQHQDYGHNGAHILDFTYSDDEGWEMISAEERRIKCESY